MIFIKTFFITLIILMGVYTYKLYKPMSLAFFISALIFLIS